MTKEEDIKNAIDLITENYPAVAPLFNSRMHHIKAKYAGVIAIAVAACELLSVALA